MGKFDEVWKDVIEGIFQDFVCFYMPDLAEDIDFTKPSVFLDKEFSTIEINSEDRVRYLDKLVKIYMKNGDEIWALLHIDVQHANKDDFSLRMFKYFYRVLDKYNKKIVSQIIFTGNYNYQKEFNYSFYNTELNYKYRSLRLIDYDETELLNSDNPFALVTLAVKYAIDSNSDEELRYNFKSKLMRLMLTRKYSHKKIENLFKFIEIMLELSDVDLNKKFFAELRKMAKEGDIMVITKFEEMAMEKEKINIAKNLLKIGMPVEQIAQVTELSLEKVLELSK